MKPRILVTSAAGSTGIPTTLGLLEKGFGVRAFVRRQDARSQRLHDAGAELFVGDQFDYRDVRNALTDVQRAYVCPPPGPNTSHFAAVFAAAAHEAQLEHVVTLSQWLSAPDHLASTTERRGCLIDSSQRSRRPLTPSTTWASSPTTTSAVSPPQPSSES